MDLTDFDGKLSKGEILGFETDTVWGLGCLPNDGTAVDKIYEIKGRDRSKPLILMSNNLESLLPYVVSVPDYAKNLMDRHFPGALTLIFEKSELTPFSITSGKNTVGIRIPAHSGFCEICSKIGDENGGKLGETWGGVLATTSLNRSNEPPVKDYKEAIKEFGYEFGDGVKIIKPEKPCSIGVSSTVVLCTGPAPVVLRQGNVEI